MLNHTVVSAQCNDFLLIWEDDFSGDQLDESNWQYELGGGGWGNNELQTYTDENAEVSNGVLQIIADEPSPDVYESSRIRSKNLFDIKYGKIEASIKLPEGQGIWPAFWMLPTYQVYGFWPTSGEIDIMEYLGHDTDLVHMTCHYGNTAIDKGQIGTTYTLPTGDFTQAFHTFTIEWTQDNIKWYIDDILVQEVNYGDTAPYIYPFNETYHLLLNVAVGGNFPGDPDETTTFPQIMEVDYVRAYQLVEDWTITGDELVLPNETQTAYSISEYDGATYDWIIPDCATIVSGEGSHEITVDWGEDSGDISVIIGLDCQTITRSINVVMSNDLLQNGNFQFGTTDWYSSFFNGGTGSFNIEPIADTYNGTEYACIEVNSLGNNFWDVQIGNQEMSVTNGEILTLEFFARSDQNGREMRIDFRDGSNNTSTDNHIFALSDAWSQYTYTYTAPYDIAEFFIDFNHGLEVGTYCYDDVSLTQDSPSIGVCDNVECLETLILNEATIEDGSYHASEYVDSKSEIVDGQTVDLSSDGEVILSAGFETTSDCDFSAEIESCEDQ